jgi:protein TonB
MSDHTQQDQNIVEPVAIARPHGEIVKPFSTLLASKPPKTRSAGAYAFSLVLHGAVVGAIIWATLRVEDAITEEDEPEFVELVEEMAPPPPPPPPPVDAPELTEVVQGFQELTIPDIVPPDIPPAAAFSFRAEDFSGEGVAGGTADGRAATLADLEKKDDDVSAAPTFTPYTVSPDLRNRDEVARALEREYPPLLRDAGLGGKVNVWLFINEEGIVQNTRVNESSGHPSLDEAALKVAGVMRFTPALNRDKKVPVWVSIPITFQVR